MILGGGKMFLLKKIKINHLICIIFSVIFIFPLILTITNSFMSIFEIKNNYNNLENQFMFIRLIPKRISLNQYFDLLIRNPMYLNLFWNAIKYVVPIVFFNILFSFITSYALFRINNKITDFIFLIYVIVMLMPYQVICVPNFIIINKLNLMDSYFAIVLPAIFNPLGTFLLRVYISSIPNSYIESAKIEGASEFDICFNIVLPMIKSGIISLFIIMFIEYWNMVEQPLIFLQSKEKFPLSVFLSSISNKDPSLIFAASSFYMIPAIIIFLYLQKYFIKGIAMSGLKQ